MPRYSFACDDCDYQWEDTLTYDDRDTPIHGECPNCESLGNIRRTFRINFNCDSFATPKLNDTQKDLMRQIKKANKGSNIPDY